MDDSESDLKVYDLNYGLKADPVPRHCEGGDGEGVNFCYILLTVPERMLNILIFFNFL